MNKFEIRTNKKKEAILKASRELFQKNGFINTGIKEIAALANVSQVSIYNYFGSKNLLVKEAISFIMDDIVVMLDEILSLTLPFTHKLTKAISLCNEEIGHKIEDYFSVTALEDPQMVQAMLDAVTDKKMIIYERFIEVGKKEGCIDDTIPTSTILDYVKAFDSIGSTPEYLQQDSKYREDLLRLLLSGLLINN